MKWIRSIDKYIWTLVHNLFIIWCCLTICFGLFFPPPPRPQSWSKYTLETHPKPQPRAAIMQVIEDLRPILYDPTI